MFGVSCKNALIVVWLTEYFGRFLWDRIVEIASKFNNLSVAVITYAVFLCCWSMPFLGCF
jgi:hypothetical protein